MTNLFRTLTALCTLLALVSCTVPAGQEPWRSILGHYHEDPGVRELLLVQCDEGSNATVFYYQKTGGTQRWKLRGKGDAFIGKNGLGKKREGDAKTPEGDFSVLTAFGILPDPGTALPWLPVTSSTFACDEEGPYYNRIIDTVATHHACRGEDMFHTAPEYNYGLALDYNAEGLWPDGSAIFFHCRGAKTWTGGCIAVDEAFLRHILTTARPGLRVIIH
ncbi:MAG: hypothetical protein IJ654_06855 [Bacteroidales bacterium]|nr:hypothetical protein [Bacteroidales bacterium]